MRLMRLLLPAAMVSTILFGAADASANVECVKSRCEGKGRTCVETLYVSYNACVKAARASCDKFPPAEKFNCLTGGLKPCAQTRNQEQAACLADVQSCYKSCGPTQGKQIDYWCVADTRSGATAVFCSANPNTSPSAQCEKAFPKSAQLDGGMTCDSVQ